MSSKNDKQKEDLEKSVDEILKQYFPVCPFCCGNVVIKYTQWAKDIAHCLDCAAKWHIHLLKDWNRFPLDMTKAMLIEDGIDEAGEEFLMKWHDGTFWKRMALKAKRRLEERQADKPSVEVREKQIVKEVIVKIRCPYCKYLYDETLDKCPHCSGRR